MKLKKTSTNQLVAEKKPCKSCGAPTLFKSSVLPGMRICPTCEPKVREEKAFHEARERNAQNKRSYQRKNRRGSNQYQLKPRGQRTWLMVLIVILFSILLFGVLNAILNPSLDDKFLNREAEASFISPVATGSATIVPSPTITPADGGEEAFLRRVHMLESTAGRNTNLNALHNVCESRGGSNQYGYGGMALMICFGSHEEATARVARWYREHRATRTEAQTYCYYAYGLNQDDCSYWRKAQTL